MRRIATLAVSVMIALGIGVLIQPSSALASVSGGGCTPSSQRDGYNGWRASACISYNTTAQRVEWDGYIDIHGSHCHALTLRLFRNGNLLDTYNVGCSRTGHIPMHYYYTTATGGHDSRPAITYDNGNKPFLWKSPQSHLR